MRRWNVTRRIVLVAMAACLLCFTPAHAKKPPKPGGGEGQYNLVMLAPPGIEITGSLARDLDESGNVVGYYSDSVNDRNGFYYDRGENSYVLYDPGVEVSGLNNLGKMVGTDWNAGEGLYWSSPDATPIPLSALYGHQTSLGSKINDAGIIVGNSQGDVPPVAVAWKVNEEGAVSAPIELPFLQGYVLSIATGLSEGDADGISRIVGCSGLYERAVMWEVAVDADGELFLLSGPTDLGSLDGGASAAHGVNLHGDIVGESDTWPFVKPAGQPMQALPGIKKATNGSASAINDLGQMVGSQGYLFHHAAIFKAVLWPDTGSVIDLNKKVALGGDEELESAYVINNAGDILASGFLPGVTEAGNVGCLLTPK